MNIENKVENTYCSSLHGRFANDDRTGTIAVSGLEWLLKSEEEIKSKDFTEVCPIVDSGDAMREDIFPTLTHIINGNNVASIVRNSSEKDTDVMPTWMKTVNENKTVKKWDEICGEDESDSWESSSSLSTSTECSQGVLSDSGYARLSGSKSTSPDLELDEAMDPGTEEWDCGAHGEVSQFIQGGEETLSREIELRLPTTCHLRTLSSTNSPGDRNIIGDLVSSNIIGYLSSVGMALCTEIRQSPNPSNLFQKLHHIVKSFREILTLMDNTCTTYITEDDQKLLNNYTKKELTKNEEFHRLLLCLIRSYDSNVAPSKCYLVDLIEIIHRTFLILDEMGFNLQHHLQQFATVQVMASYGEALQDYKTNSNFINESVLTMMHHVAGDLESPHVLFQQNILETFCALIDDDETSEVVEWEELMHYILHEFYHKARYKDPKHYNVQNSTNSDGLMEHLEEMFYENNLYSWYLQPDDDSSGKINKIIEDSIDWETKSEHKDKFLQDSATIVELVHKMSLIEPSSDRTLYNLSEPAEFLSTFQHTCSI